MMVIAYGGMVAGALLFLTMIVSILRQSKQDNDKPGHTILSTKELLLTTDDPELIAFREWQGNKAYADFSRYRDPSLYKLVMSDPKASTPGKIAFIRMCVGELGHPMYENLDTSTMKFTDIQFEFLADLFPDKVSMDS